MWWLLLIACQDEGRSRAQRPEPAPPLPLTDTLPAFRGQVPRNVLMISIDTFRKDSLSRYGGPVVMPYLDSLAEQGFVLDDHTTCSNWTLAGTTCTLLGQDLVDAGLPIALVAGGQDPLPEDRTFLAESLASAGYRTVLVSANTFLGPNQRNDQGYARSENPPFENATRLAETAWAHLDTLDPGGEDPWLVHLHLMEPHAAYRPPEAYLDAVEGLDDLGIDFENREEHYYANIEYGLWSPEQQETFLAQLWGRYRGELTYVDDQLRTLLQEADRQGRLEDTLVVFWNDHGEAFFEHGVQTHATTLHGEENDGVLVFWAKNIEPGAWSGPTAAIDLAPTLLHLLAVPATLDAPAGQVLGSAPIDRTRFGWSVARGQPKMFAQQGSYKLHFEWNGRLMLFDRSVDPGEQQDLYTPDHPAVAPLWSSLVPRIEAAQALLPRTLTWPEELPR